MEFITTGNSTVATTVAAGITIEKNWDWDAYTNLMQGSKPNISCPVCEKQKSKDQVVCGVCYTNILDSRNGFYRDRLSRKEPEPTSQ